MSKEELLELTHRSDQFTTKSKEVELILYYLSPSTKEVEEFMSTTDILRYLKEIIFLNYLTEKKKEMFFNNSFYSNNIF